VKDDPGEEHSPYDAPEASLETGDAGCVISAKALRLLVSSRWWMIMAAVALMVNGATLVLAVFYMLATAEAMPTPLKLLMALVVVAAHLVFLPGLRLMQSALALGRAQESREEKDIVHALHRHEEFWKLLGIAFLMVGGLLFYGLLFAIR
jgi:hypothetical protein